MPAGTLLNVAVTRQVEIRSTLTGAGTDWLIGEVGIQGLDALVKANESSLGHASGTYAGPEHDDGFMLAIPYLIDQATEGAAFSRYLTLLSLYSSSTFDLELHMMIDGIHVAVVGRPRGAVGDLSEMPHGVVEALASFKCTSGDLLVLDVPGAPTIGTATAGAGSVTGNWSAPASNGGSPVTLYEMAVHRASDAVALTSGTTTGLTGTLPSTAGVPVFVKVKAENAFGSGPFSAASNTVTAT